MRTLAGLFLFEPIDTDQSYKPTEELIQLMKRAEHYESALLQKRQLAMQAL